METSRSTYRCAFALAAAVSIASKTQSNTRALADVSRTHVVLEQREPLRLFAFIIRGSINDILVFANYGSLPNATSLQNRELRRRRLLGKDLDVHHVEHGATDVREAVHVRYLGSGGEPNGSFFGGGRDPILAGELTLDRSAAQLHGHVVQRVPVKQRRLSRLDDDIQHKHVLILENNVMMRLLLNGHGIRRRARS
jgi:hypothetical protein